MTFRARALMWRPNDWGKERGWQENLYFQRIRFDLADLAVGASNTPVLERSIADLAERYGMQWRLFYDYKVIAYMESCEAKHVCIRIACYSGMSCNTARQPASARAFSSANAGTQSLG